MNALQALVLGIVQGLTEFLPISSSAHLILVPWLFGWHFFLDDPSLNKTFDVALHLGTFIALLVFFWGEIIGLVRAFVRSLARRRIEGPDERLAWLLLITAIPASIVGVLLESFVEERLGQPWLIAVLLIVFGLIMWVVDRYASTRRGMEDLRWTDALLVGLAQVLALAPGVSRSGVTMVTGRALEMRRETAVRFSFLAAIPVIGGAAAYKGLKVAVDGLPAGTHVPFLIGIAAAAVSGYFAVRFLLAYVGKHDFGIFVLYRLVLGLTLLGLIAAGVR